MVALFSPYKGNGFLNEAPSLQRLYFVKKMNIYCALQDMVAPFGVLLRHLEYCCAL